MRLKNLLFWCALPFALPQAILVKKNALRLPDASGKKYGGSPESSTVTPRFNIVGIGDSVIVGVGVKELNNALVAQTAQHIAAQCSHQVSWQVIGKNGANSQDIYQRILPQLTTQPADLFILSVGVNDVTSLTSINQWQQNLHAIITTLHSHSPAASIVFAGVPPMGDFPLLPQPLRFLLGMRASALDNTAQIIAADYPYVTYIPLDFELHPQNIAEDGFHPSAQACQLFGQIISERVTIPC